MSNIISFTGFQSTGKSTATFALASELKKIGCSVNLWTDMPRRSPLATNEKGGTGTQFWIMSKMIQETLELAQIYDWVITDRTPFDCVVYEAVISNGFTPTAKVMLEYLKAFREYSDTKIVYVESGYDFTMEKGRSYDPDFIERSRMYFDLVYGQMVEVDYHIEDLRQLDMKEFADELYDDIINSGR